MVEICLQGVNLLYIFIAFVIYDMVIRPVIGMVSGLIWGVIKGK